MSPDPAFTDDLAAAHGAAPSNRGRSLTAWVRTIGLALLVAFLLRTCAFEPFQIPSESMEGTLLVGDFLLVSKLHYGARIPATVGVPFIRGRIPTGLPTTRLPGFAAVARGDVVVFNYPPHRGPLDGRMPFIKRVVGLPGDTVEVSGKVVLVNGVRVPPPPSARQLWRVRLGSNGEMDPDSLATIDARERGGHESERLVEAPVEGAARLIALPGVERVTPYMRPAGDGSARFPPGADYSLDHYGPVTVPRRGQTVPLNDSTWPLVREAIAREATAAGRPAPARRLEAFLVDGAPASSYTFREDHYFVMGDNRDDSADSRTWGFVPASFMIGKAVVVYFSWDPAAGRPRWGRALRGIE